MNVFAVASRCRMKLLHSMIIDTVTGRGYSYAALQDKIDTGACAEAGMLSPYAVSFGHSRQGSQRLTN
jgi:hypothetical protein